MPTYTFVCLGHDGTVATVESGQCDDDQAARIAAAHLFDEAPLIRDWPNCRQIEIYEGAELVGRVRREPFAPPNALADAPADTVEHSH